MFLSHSCTNLFNFQKFNSLQHVTACLKKPLSINSHPNRKGPGVKTFTKQIYRGDGVVCTLRAAKFLVPVRMFGQN